jgi:hypothetical protein
MSSFVKFLNKYANEAVSIASALNSVLSGIALPTTERNKVEQVIAELQKASASILSGIKSVTEPSVKISKADIAEAVAKVLPSVLKEEVAKAVALALEEQAKLNAEKSDDSK